MSPPALRGVLRAALVALAAAGCGREIEPVISCEAVGPARPVCGFHNPEDLELLPDGRSLLVSEFGSIDGTRPGAIARLDLATDARTVLYRGGDGGVATPGWGDPACPGPPPAAMSPHGIHLARRADGALELLVVNHGGRESVELFEVLEAPAGATVAWRGCAVAPEAAWLNDVVALPGGGLLATHMLPRRDGLGRVFEYVKAGALGMATGSVLEWRPGRGFAPLAGTQTVFANGIAISADGRTIFVNASIAGEVRRIDRASGRLEGIARVAGPDNSTWAPDGRLLVASFTGSLRENLACDGIPRGACPVAFEIVAVDPVTFATETLYRGGGAPMGGGTVGLRVGDELFVGSFAGDRILRVRLLAGTVFRFSDFQIRPAG
jgi:hypothetical protein